MLLIVMLELLSNVVDENIFKGMVYPGVAVSLRDVFDDAVYKFDSFNDFSK